MKIAIIGCPGSGKSTVAQQLHERLKIPLYHLDQYYWLPGWQRPDKDAFEKIHNALCDKTEWIIEGPVYADPGHQARQATTDNPPQFSGRINSFEKNGLPTVALCVGWPCVMLLIVLYKLM